jgi:outer membrane murein-binding lipoprotein Lpp
MTLDGPAKQLIRELSTLRADVRANASEVEQIRDEVKAVHELVADVPMMSDFRRLEQRVDDLHADVKAIKSVVRDHSGELAELDARVRAPEAA